MNKILFLIKKISMNFKKKKLEYTSNSNILCQPIVSNDFITILYDIAKNKGFKADSDLYLEQKKSSTYDGNELDLHHTFIDDDIHRAIQSFTDIDNEANSMKYIIFAIQIDGKFEDSDLSKVDIFYEYTSDKKYIIFAITELQVQKIIGLSNELNSSILSLLARTANPIISNNKFFIDKANHFNFDESFSIIDNIPIDCVPFYDGVHWSYFLISTLFINIERLINQVPEIIDIIQYSIYSTYVKSSTGDTCLICMITHDKLLHIYKLLKSNDSDDAILVLDIIEEIIPYLL